MRLRAVRMAAPRARIIVDANEGWRPEDLPTLLAVCVDCGVELVEQPLPADADEALARVIRPVPVCADESAHGAEDLPALRSRYDAINIKLDKTGGLTGAIRLAKAARNALDCALWDLEAARTGRPVWQLAGFRHPAARARPLGLMTPGPKPMSLWS